MATEKQVNNITKADCPEKIERIIQDLIKSGEATPEQVQENFEDKMKKIAALQKMYGLLEDLSPEQREIFEEAINRKE